MPFTCENADVRPPEGSVAKGVTHRVDSGVDVTQGVEEIPQLLGDAAGARREGLQQHQDVVRSPRDDE